MNARYGTVSRCGWMARIVAVISASAGAPRNRAGVSGGSTGLGEVGQRLRDRAAVGLGDAVGDGNRKPQQPLHGRPRRRRRGSGRGNGSADQVGSVGSGPGERGEVAGVVVGTAAGETEQPRTAAEVEQVGAGAAGVGAQQRRGQRTVGRCRQRRGGGRRSGRERWRVDDDARQGGRVGVAMRSGLSAPAARGADRRLRLRLVEAQLGGEPVRDVHERVHGGQQVIGGGERHQAGPAAGDGHVGDDRVPVDGYVSVIRAVNAPASGCQATMTSSPGRCTGSA